MRLRLGKLTGKPTLMVRTIEWFSTFWTPDSIYDEAEQQAGTDRRPSNREKHAEGRLRVKHDAHRDASEQSQQACQ
jgi:hypothetical protein